MRKNILARVEEKHVLGALKELPHPEEVAKDEFRETVIEVPRLGRVRFTCYRIVGTRGDYHWAFWADQGSAGGVRAIKRPDERRVRSENAHYRGWMGQGPLIETPGNMITLREIEESYPGMPSGT